MSSTNDEVRKKFLADMRHLIDSTSSNEPDALLRLGPVSLEPHELRWLVEEACPRPQDDTRFLRGQVHGMRLAALLVRQNADCICADYGTLLCPVCNGTIDGLVEAIEAQTPAGVPEMSEVA